MVVEINKVYWGTPVYFAILIDNHFSYFDFFHKEQTRRLSMTDQQLLIHHRKVMIEQYISQSISVKDICNRFHISRPTFYKWFNRYRSLGQTGLYNKVRSLGPQPNQLSVELEKVVLDYAYQNPSHGPMNIALNLSMIGIYIGKTAVYNALKRHGLNLRRDRLQRLQQGQNKVISKHQLDRELAKKRSLKTKAPGYLVAMDTAYVGTIKGIGRIYQMTAIDTFSNYAWAKVYTAKTAKSACDFLLHIKNNTHGRFISRILTDNGLEFTTHHQSKNHKFEDLLSFYKIKHTYTKIRHPWTNGAVERLNQTYNQEFYQVTFRKKIYCSLQELQDDLDQFTDYYNFQRPNQGKRTKGNVPGKLFLLHNYFFN
jgi:transposase InsO family protein